MQRNVLAVTLLLSTLAIGVAQDRRWEGDRDRRIVTVLADGRTLKYPNNATPYYDRTLMLPVKETAKQLKVRYRDAQRGEEIHLSYRGTEAVYIKGDRSYQLNGDQRRLTDTSTDIDRTTFVPADLFRDLTKREIVGVRPGEERFRPIGDLDIQYRGKILRFGGRELPFEERGVLYLPVRSMARQTDVNVDQCDQDSVVLTQRGDRLRLETGRQEFVINGRLVHSGATSREIEGTVFVPIVVFETLLGSDLVCEGASWQGNRPIGIGSRREIELQLDGRRMGFGKDQRPYRRGGDNFVPLFDFCRKIDVRFQRLDRDEHRIRLTQGQIEVVYEQPLPFYELNGRRIPLRQGSESVRQVLFVPLELLNAFTNGRVTVKEQ